MPYLLDTNAIIALMKNGEFSRVPELKIENWQRG